MTRLKKFLIGFFSLFCILVGSVGAQNVIMGEVIPGQYKPVVIDKYGNAIPIEYTMATAFGDLPQSRRVVGVGNNPLVGTATLPEDIWTGGGVYPWMTGATNLEILSASASDTLAGTGARSVTVTCLDVNYVEVIYVVNLNGVTPASIGSCFRINTAQIISAGSGQINAGDITIRDSGGGTTRAIVQAGFGVSRQSQYTVPAGYTLQIVSLYAAALKNSVASAVLDVAVYVGRPTLGYYTLPAAITNSLNGAVKFDAAPVIIIQEKQDFSLRVTAASANAEVAGIWLGVMRKNIP